MRFCEYYLLASLKLALALALALACVLLCLCSCWGFCVDLIL